MTYRLDIRGPAGQKFAALETLIRQDLLRELGGLGELAEDQGLLAFGPVARLWTDIGRCRVLYTLDTRKRVLAVIDVIAL